MEEKPIEATYEQLCQQALIQEYRLEAALSVLETQGLIKFSTKSSLCDIMKGMRYLYEKAIHILKEQEGAKND